MKEYCIIIYYSKEEKKWKYYHTDLWMRIVRDWDFPHYQFSFNYNKDSPDYQKFYDKAIGYLEDWYKPYRIENPSRAEIKGVKRRLLDAWNAPAINGMVAP